MSNHVKCPTCYKIVNEMDLVDDLDFPVDGDMTLEDDEPPMVRCPSCNHGMSACDWQVNVFWMPDDYAPRRVFAKRSDTRRSERVVLVQRLLFTLQD